MIAKRIAALLVLSLVASAQKVAPEKLPAPDATLQAGLRRLLDAPDAAEQRLAFDVLRANAGTAHERLVPQLLKRAIERGIAFLIERQQGGTWEEAEYTGTGFPGYGVGATIKLGDPLLTERLKQGPELSRAFMINYNLYRHYFPLMAMGRWRSVAAGRI